ncbi:ABC transporter permease [Acetobacterium tundrae]|uniref:ABC transporter permease n=1 Tax=Acetobacterium tundrae TaxID=132932 RepID=A0ABR6WKC4_9FIRM|nr:ABC transporter permease [Acetobacterium tundrae]MBC3796967.1 ABC transporter permease [Acetobacterium tundrae]
MNAFIYQLGLQWRLDIRNRGILLTYYLIPLGFFLFMGGIFTSINPEAYQTIIPSMTVFGVTMGAVLGMPTQLVTVFGTDIKKSYIVGKIPLWTAVAVNILSCFFHLMIMSLIILLIAPILFGAVIPAQIGVYLVNTAIFIMATLSIGSILGVFVKNGSKLSIVAQVIFLPSIMLSGIMFSTDLLPEFLEKAGLVLPATWGFKNLCDSGIDLNNIFPLLLMIVISFLIVTLKLMRSKTE